jgi:predicted nucleotidyltransferase
MAKKRTSVKKIAQAYIAALKKSHIHVLRAFLFGSYAQHRFDENSDIDIAIVSNDFSGNRFSDRRVIVPLRRSIDKRIDPLPYRPEDFNESDPLVSAILKTGIQIDR